MSTHTLSVVMFDVPGAAARVTSLIATRRFDITSLAIGATERDNVVRMTIVVDAEPNELEQLIKHLNRLVDVLKVVELHDEQTVARELLLVKVRVSPEQRTEVTDLAGLFRARVVDVGRDSLIVETTGDAAKTTALLDVMTPYGVQEIVKTGVVALGRGARSITDRTLRV